MPCQTCRKLTVIDEVQWLNVFKCPIQKVEVNQKRISTFRVPQFDDNQRSARGFPVNPHQGARSLDLETPELLRPLRQRRQQR